MQTISEISAKIAGGWDCRHEITDRAILMRRHAEAGNHERADEYAREIDAIQELMHEERQTHLANPTPFRRDPDGREEWRIKPAPWAELLLHGHLVRRDFWPEALCTRAEALRHINGAYYVRPMVLTAHDIEPVYGSAREVAA